MKKYHLSFILLLCLSCNENRDNSPVINIPEPISIKAFDYGDTGTSKDILVGVFFGLEPGDQYTFFAIIVKISSDLSLEDAASICPDCYEEIKMESKTYKDNFSNILKDSDGDQVVINKDYKIYLLIIDNDNAKMKISSPSQSFKLTDQDNVNVYSLSHSISGRDPYLLDTKSHFLTDAPISTDMIFDKEGNLLLLTRDEGILEYDMDGQFLNNLVPIELMKDPKLLRIGPDENLYVVDGSSIVRFDRSSGAFLDIYMDNLISPGSIAWDQFDNIYITEKIENGRILTFDKSKKLVNEFSFKNPSIIPKSVTFNTALQQIYINRTSINGTGIVAFYPDTFEWQLLGSLTHLGTFSDYIETNPLGNIVLVREDHSDGPQIVIVEHKADVDLEIIATSTPLNGIPVSITLGPVK